MTITPRAASGADVDEDIERLVDEAPPLSPEQRDRLAILLRPAVVPRQATGRRGVSTGRHNVTEEV
ncbi:hypothetical protein [Amycolatopsis sp. YIM 10]|uniref:hypothetical protein n=1 Tax=Amycolatopsis sp. YIM 10 TaxID=2653857 RepID=UPI001290010A|nr:hypothetical protein [Amycolatopsis sp. YIM 10]